jgi:hypothetical protein
MTLARRNYQRFDHVSSDIGSFEGREVQAAALQRDCLFDGVSVFQ